MRISRTPQVAIGRAIRLRREEVELTQEALADAANMDVTSIRASSVASPTPRGMSLTASLEHSGSPCTSLPVEPTNWKHRIDGQPISHVAGSIGRERAGAGWRRLLARRPPCAGACLAALPARRRRRVSRDRGPQASRPTPARYDVRLSRTDPPPPVATRVTRSLIVPYACGAIDCSVVLIGKRRPFACRGLL